MSHWTVNKKQFDQKNQCKCMIRMSWPLCLLPPPVAVEALAEAGSRVGAELGPGPGVRAIDVGAGRDAFSGEGREAFSVAGGLRVLLELLGLLSGVSSVFSDLLFTQEEEEKEEEEPPWAAGRATESKQEDNC